MANYKIDEILTEIKTKVIVEGKHPADIAKQLNENPNVIRYIIKQIKKSHCNGATAEYAKYSQFEYKEAFCENDLVSIVLKNN
jgi:DNA-binding CsgD family transcriptional regulator